MRDSADDQPHVLVDGLIDKWGTPQAGLKIAIAGEKPTREAVAAESPADAAEQVAWLLREKGVQTVCVHGDNPRALAFVRELRDQLTRLGYRLTPIGRLPAVNTR